MLLTVTQAQSEAERLQAQQLVQTSYAQEFEVDLVELSRVAPVSFRSVVLLVWDQGQQLLATASIFYPTETGLFPSHYLFSAHIRQDTHPLSLPTMVEIGRLAIGQTEDKGLVLKAILLAISAYLHAHQLAGWIATVQPRIRRLLTNKGLLTEPFDQLPDSPVREAYSLLLAGYTKKGIISFWVSASSTHRVCRDMDSLVEQGLVQIKLILPTAPGKSSSSSG